MNDSPNTVYTITAGFCAVAAIAMKTNCRRHVLRDEYGEIITVFGSEAAELLRRACAIAGIADTAQWAADYGICPMPGYDALPLVLAQRRLGVDATSLV